jgi:hypothetical protein
LFALLTALPASAQVGNFTRVVINGTNVSSGSGTPEGSVTGAVGDVYLRTSNGTIYTKTSGSSTTGWTLSTASGSGTVTSVGVTFPSIFSAAGSPITTSGTIAASLATQSAKTFFGGPTSGSAAVPTFRSLAIGDLPVCASTEIYKSDGSAMVCDDDAGASSGAPTASQYVTLATDGTLANERVLTAGTGIAFTDGGAGSTLTVAADGANIGSLSAANISAGTLAVARGGTNLTAAADDEVMVGNGTTWQSKAIADCDNGTTDKLLYDTGTNAFSCGTDQSSGGDLDDIADVDTTGVADGDVLTFDSGSGDWVAAAPTGGSGGLVLLEQHTASASSTLDFDSWYSSTYDDYEIHLVDVMAGTTAQALQMRVSNDTGSSYISSGYHYGLITVTNLAGSASSANTGGSAAGQFLIFSALDTGGDGVRGVIRLMGPGGSATRKTVLINVTASTSASHGSYNGFGTVLPGSSTGIDAVRFFMSSGNIASGTIRIYGVVK